MNNENLFAENGDRNTENNQWLELTDTQNSKKESKIYEFQLETEAPKGWGKRHTQILLGSFCVSLAFIVKINIGMAVVAMTNPKHNNISQVFDWNKKQQNYIMSSFFFGYLLMMMPFGAIAQRFGGKKPIIVCLGICGLLSLVFPILAKVGGWFTACVCRFMQGLAAAGILPCLHNMLGKWSPLLERGRATAYIYTGSQIGKMFITSISGYLSASSIGWPLIFYVSGLCILIGCLMMWWLGAESPNHHSTISKVEFDYIKRTSGGNAGQKKLKTPWRMIFRNVPFLATITAQCGFLWNLNTTMFEMPPYMNSILGVNIKSNGLLNAAPYVAMCLLSLVFSHFFDYLLKRRSITVTMARKISNTIGMWMSGALLVAFSFTPATQLSWAIFLMILSMGATAGVYSGLSVTLTDISPNFSGSTMSIGATFGNLVAATATLVNGSILSDMNDIGQWRTVFGLSAGIMFVTNLLFIIFGTSEMQSWNSDKDTSQKKCDL